MWRKHAHLPALDVSMDCQADRREKVATLRLLRRDPCLPRLPLPLPVARLGGGSSDCLAGPAVLHQRGFERGGCHGCLHSVCVPCMFLMLDDVGILYSPS